MTRRYPLEDLLEATGLSESGLTRRAGISGSTLVRARERGFTADAADRYAVRCGLSPMEVWHDYGLVECPGCGVLFAPRDRNHRYHSPNCSSAHRRRIRYQTDPSYAEGRKRAARELYEECGEYVRRRNRDYKARRRQEAAA